MSEVIEYKDQKLSFFHSVKKCFLRKFLDLDPLLPLQRRRLAPLYHPNFLLGFIKKPINGKLIIRRKVSVWFSQGKGNFVVF